MVRDYIIEWMRELEEDDRLSDLCRNTEIVGGGLNAGDQVVVGETQTSSKPKTGTPMRMF